MQPATWVDEGKDALAAAAAVANQHALMFKERTMCHSRLREATLL